MLLLPFLLSLVNVARAAGVTAAMRDAAPLAAGLVVDLLELPGGQPIDGDALPAEQGAALDALGARLFDGVADAVAQVDPLVAAALRGGLADGDILARLQALAAERGDLDPEAAAGLAAMQDMIDADVPPVGLLDIFDAPEERGEVGPALALAEHLHHFDGDPEALRLIFAALLVDAGIDPADVFEVDADDADLAALTACADVDALAEALDALRGAG